MAEMSEPTVIEKPKKKRGPGRPFKKGQSGNPAGRKKIPEDVKEAFEKLTPIAVAKLQEIIESPTTKDADRVRAIDIALDRGLGKPVQAVNLETTGIQQVVFYGADNIPD